MLRDSARALICDKAPVSHLRQLRDSRDATGFSRGALRKILRKGIAGLLIPEDFAGAASVTSRPESSWKRSAVR